MKSETESSSAVEAPTGEGTPATEGTPETGGRARGSGDKGSGNKRNRPRGNGGRRAAAVGVYTPEDLLAALQDLESGNFGTRLPERGNSLNVRIAQAFNRVARLNEAMVDELGRISRTVGREGKSTDRAELSGAHGDWARGVGSVNALITDLMQPTQEVARTLTAVAQGDLSQKMSLEI